MITWSIRFSRSACRICPLIVAPSLSIYFSAGPTSFDSSRGSFALFSRSRTSSVTCIPHIQVSTVKRRKRKRKTRDKSHRSLPLKRSNRRIQGDAEIGRPQFTWGDRPPMRERMTWGSLLEVRSGTFEAGRLLTHWLYGDTL